MTRAAVLGLATLASLAAAPAGAQDTVIVRRPGYARGTPADERAVAVFNAEGTTRLFGEQTIGRDAVIRTDVGFLDGPVKVYGTIEGDLVAINADVSIYAGAEVRGDVLVLGGTLFTSSQAEISGTVERHSEHIGVRVVDGRLELVGEPIRRVWVQRERRLRRSFGQSSASLAITTGGTYNRVEGLPVMAGPRLTWRYPGASFRLEGLAIWRTATGFEPNLDNREAGYRALGDLRLGPSGREQQLELGGKAYDLVMPIEDWQLKDDEVGLAAFLWHRDFRDYYLSRGVAGFARLMPAPGLSLFGEIARNQETSVAARDPWTPFRDAEPWRANPAVDEGHFIQLKAGLDLDTRYYDGWRAGASLHAEWEHGESDDVTERSLPLAVRSPLPLPPYQYDRVFADLRLYQPVGFGGLQLRAVGVGVVGDNPLPVQRRLSLGGPDPMPGFPFRQFACNGAVADPALPALCDRLALFQAEYRGGLDINPFDGDWWDHDAWRRPRPRGDRNYRDDFWWDGPQFVLFADAGTAWLKADGPGQLHWDAGAGLEFGSVALYAARAIERNQPIRLFVRIHRRF